MTRSSVTTNERKYRDDTLDDYELGVVKCIQLMHERFGEALNIDILATAACMSRFHFIRVFNQITGVSPGRFLAAIRMQEAKRLLLKTDITITRVALDVGYQSVNTFSRLYSDYVGFSPSQFRELATPLCSIPLKNLLPFFEHRIEPLCESNMVSGEVQYDGELTMTVVGVFESKITRKLPSECKILVSTNRFTLRKTSSRNSYIFAAGLRANATFEDAILGSNDQVIVGGITIGPSLGKKLRFEIAMRDRKRTELPIVIAFPLILIYKF